MVPTRLCRPEQKAITPKSNTSSCFFYLFFIPVDNLADLAGSVALSWLYLFSTRHNIMIILTQWGGMIVAIRAACPDDQREMDEGCLELWRLRLCALAVVVVVVWRGVEGTFRRANIPKVTRWAGTTGGVTHGENSAFWHERSVWLKAKVMGLNTRSENAFRWCVWALRPPPPPPANYLTVQWWKYGCNVW